MENILVSSCLLGVSCRWHGKKLYASTFLKKYINNPKFNIISACPEILGGLPIPRPPVKRSKGRVFTTCDDKSLRYNFTGEDITDSFVLGAKKTLKICLKNNCKTAIMCKWSPSCDITGITGKMLKENGINVINTF